MVMTYIRAPDRKDVIFSIMPISSSNPMFDHLFERRLKDLENKAGIQNGRHEKSVCSSLKKVYFLSICFQISSFEQIN